MNRTKTVILAIIAGLVIFSLTAFMPVKAAASSTSLAAQTTTHQGWLTDLDGNLIRDNEGYYVLTISSDMVSGTTMTLDLNRYAALFLDDFYNESSARAAHKLKIVNQSGKKLTYTGYEFTTENVLPRTSNIFNPTTGTLTPNSLNRAFGSAYTAMLSTITSPRFRTDLCLDVKGFDGKNINLMIAPLRTINDAIMAFYGVDASYDITLPQMMQLDANLIAAGYDGYADYLRQYYGVDYLYELDLETIYNVLGTTNGAQSAITNWQDNTIGGKPVPASQMGLLTEQFKIWGIAALNMDPSDRAIYPYIPNYFMMETDAEVIQFAYDYLYTHGLRFSFDQSARPFDITDSESGRGGNFGIKAYLNRTPGADANVNAVFGGLVLNNGDTFRLDRAAAGLYVPNAWNQHRLYDFGFSISFSTKITILDPIIPILPPIPKTGEPGYNAFILSQLMFLMAVIAWYIRRRKSSANIFDEKNHK